jgi:hypothetical protein
MDFQDSAHALSLLITGAWLVIFLLTRAVLLLTHLDEAGGLPFPCSASGAV